MKIFTQVNRSQGMIRTLVGLKSRITSTKPLLTMLIVLMIGLFGVNESAWATWPTYSGSCSTSGYALVADGETHSSDLGYKEDYDLAGPGATLTFKAHSTLASAGANIKVYQYVNGNWEKDPVFSKADPGKEEGYYQKIFLVGNVWIPTGRTYEDNVYSVPLNPLATKLRFRFEGSLNKFLCNIRVTRYSNNAYALYTSPLDCGSADYNLANSDANYTMGTAYVDWSHKNTLPTCSITGSHKDYFAIQTKSNTPQNNSYGAMSIQVAYKHTAPGDHSATLNVGGKTITIKGHTNKITPYIVTTPTVAPITYGQTISNSQLGTGLVKADLINAAGTVVSGTWTIDEKGQTVTTSGGSNTTVHLTFTPTDGNTYNTIHTTQSMFVRSVATISWASAYSAEKPTVPVGKWIENAATTNAAGAVITYSSTSSNVEISADGHSFRFTAEDEAEVVASHGVTTTHGSASETKTFKSTYKAIQVIKWADRFDRLTTEMTTKPLIAEVWIENPTTGERTYSSARTALLEYSSNNSNVVSVSATTLTIEGKGTTTLRAYVQGNDQYEEASLTMPVKVREPSEGCEDPILLNKPNDGTNDYLYRLFSMSTSKPELYSDEYEINIAQGQVPGKLSFGHKGEEYKPVSFLGSWAYYSGSIKAQQKVNGQWIDVPNSSVTPEKSKWNTIEDLQLDENATHIRIVRPQGGEGYHYVRNVEVTMKHFIRTETPEVDFGNTIKVNSSEFKDVTIHYSNVKDALSVTNPFESDVTTDDIVEVASCGAFGDAKLRITYSPTTAGPINDVIVVKDPILKTTCDIRVKADVQRADQKITWKPDTELLATETIELNGTTNGQEHGVMNAITYTVTNNDGVISVTNNVVTILKPGTVTITATQNGSTNYGTADPVEKNFTISAEPLTLVAPTAQGITYGQALSESELSGGSAKDSKGNNVGGTFAWQSPDAVLNAGDNQTPTVVFTPSTNAAWYTNLTTTANINVAKASQTITWEPATNISTIDQILLNGTTNGQENDVMNTITYTVTNNNDVISVTNNVVTILKPGTVTITASQNGSANYAAATPVVKNFTISAAPLTLTAPTAQNITYGQALSESELSGGSAKDSKGNDVGGTFAWQSPDAELNAGDNQTPTVVFTPSTNAAWYTNLTTTATIDVAKASQTITWEPATNISTIDQILLNGTTNGQENDVMNTITYTVTNNNDVISVTNNVVTILKPGTVTITASQNGSANYAAATPVVKNFTISAEPLTLTAPTAQNITYGQALSESELTGGSAKDSKNNTVYGTFAWQTGSTQPNASDDAQAFTVVFTPSTNAAWYTDLTTTATVNVNKATSAATPTAAAITYGAKVVTSELSNEGTAGSWAWKEADRNRILSAGDHTLYVNFTPSSTNYSTLEDVAVLLTVNRATATLSWTSAPTELAYNSTATYTATSVSNGAITYSIIAGEEYAHIANGVLTVDQPGHTVTIQASQVDGTNHTTPLAITQVVTIAAAPVNEFTNNNGTGDGDWSNPANWSNGLPTGDADVIISKDVTISSNITVGDLTIEKGATVLIVTGGTLTVTGETEYREAGYGDIHVKDDGNLVFENTADFKVNDFILDAKLGDGTTAREGASGQVENPGKMEIKGDAYFELALDPSGECSQGWYTFTVPFQVNALTGISRYHEGNLISITYNRNYALMVYDEAARATGGKGWNYFKGTLQPGICYTITIDDVDNVYRFKKTNDGAFNTAMTQSLHYTEGEGNGNLRGWNGLGNGTLQHINLGEVTGVDYVQIYDHDQNRYIPSALNEFTYVVGSAFFVQSPEAKPEMTYVAATPAESGILRVAKRHEATKDICLTLTKDGDEYLSDRMYVGASEDAQDSYEIGHDLAKMGTPTEAKVAQIWANEYGLKLCDVEMPLVNNSANCEINLFAPAAGNYELNVEEAPENTMLYLTYNGRAIWNLTYSPYVFDLTKGTTEGYGLKMYVMQVATDVETVSGERLEVSGNRKVLIDDVIYIVTPEGKMYDITGKSANY